MLKVFSSLALIAAIIVSVISFSNAEEALDGKQIFLDNKCESCHSVEAAGVEAKKKSDKYPDLSSIPAEHDAELLTKYMHKEAEIHGKKHPMPFKGTDAELAALISWLKGLTPQE